MTVRSWKFHGSRFAGALVLVLLVGWMVGYPVEAIGLCLMGFVLWHLINIWRFHAWLQHPQNDPPESFGIWSDIFDSIRTLDQQNRKQEARYRNMIAEFQNLTNALPDATLVIDEHDNITWCNDTAVSLLGFKVPGDLGQPVTNLLRGSDFAEWLSAEDRGKRVLEMPSPINDN